MKGLYSELHTKFLDIIMLVTFTGRNLELSPEEGERPICKACDDKGMFLLYFFPFLLSKCP